MGIFIFIVPLIILCVAQLHFGCCWRCNCFTACPLSTQAPVSPFCLFAKKKKAGRILITLECSEARKLGVPPSRYYTTKNKINTPERLELMKYNWFLRRRTLHKEVK